MINIDIQTNLFNVPECVYIDPVSEQPVTAELICLGNYEESKDLLRMEIIVDVVEKLRKDQKEYFHGLFHYGYVNAGTKKRIRDINRALDAVKMNIDALSLSQFCTHIYENVYPFLALMHPKTAIYDRLLHFIETQTLSYSEKHNFSEIETH